MLYPTELWAEMLCGGMKRQAVLLKEQLTVCCKGAALCLFYREVSMPYRVTRSLHQASSVHRFGVFSRPLIIFIKSDTLKLATG
ncbi:hypothetical protein [Herminiimonas aquatilis]|uniref:Uncharacterized protein n=1 Tax=Herminiimonas aquatilis TaxID=345342 RepID=A0ABW2J8H7_9BURK